MMDLNQLLYGVVCFVVHSTGRHEYLVLRWVWRRWFSLERNRGKGAPRWARLLVLFTVGARRQIEGPGEDAGKGRANRSHASGRYRRPADRCHADPRAASSSFLSRI